MNKLSKFIIFFLIFVDVVLFLSILLHGNTIAVFTPAGSIANQERNYIFFAIFLGLSIVIPVIIAAYVMVWKYRVSNVSATYTPDWDNNKKLQLTWLALLCGIISLVGIMVWKSSHDLDPFKPITAKNQLTIQVVALRWKWLFIYPQYGIATVNYFRFPQKTALNFQITSDAPMNSFWIPQLGGQMYAMTGMSAQLHLMSDKIGKYTGRSSNISGDGFASMTFIAESTSEGDFDTWIADVKNSPKVLGLQEYNKLTKPSQDNKPEFYTLRDQDLYNTIIMKYMTPTGTDMGDMDMKKYH